MFEQKPAEKKAAPKEQNPLWWLLGYKETPDEEKARKDRIERDKRTAENIKTAVRNIPVAKKVAADAAKKK